MHNGRETISLNGVTIIKDPYMARNSIYTLDPSLSEAFKAYKDKKNEKG